MMKNSLAKPRAAKNNNFTSSNKSVDHGVESSNSTANLFLGGRRKSWMSSSTTTPPPNFNNPRPPLRLPPPPQTRPSSSSKDGEPASSDHASGLSQGMRNPPSQLPRFPPPVVPQAGAVTAGSRQSAFSDVPLQNVSLDSQLAAIHASAPESAESALMSPVTPGPGEMLQQLEKDAACSQPAANRSNVSTTITPVMPTTGASVGSNASNVHSSSLPSPDPSNPSHPSPSSANEGNGEDPSYGVVPSPAARLAQPQTSQAQNSPLARQIPMTASLQPGGLSSTPLGTASPSQRAGQGIVHATQSIPQSSPSHPSTPGTADAAGPMVIDAAFWAQAQTKLDAILNQSGLSSRLSETVELPRVRLLREACYSRDLLYLALHQMYCYATFAPSDFAALAKFTGKPTQGFKVVEQLLVENQRLSCDFLKWCVHFPHSPQRMNTAPLYTTLVMQQVPYCLAMFHDRWSIFDAEIRRRRYPPLIDELVGRFGMTSPTMLSSIFTAMSRRLYGTRYEGRLRELYEQNARSFFQRYQPGDTQTVEQTRRTNELLVQAYVSLTSQPRNSPQAVILGPTRNSPQINSPQLVTARPQQTPRRVSIPGPPPGSTQRPHSVFSATSLRPGTQGQTGVATAQAGAHQQDSNVTTPIPPGSNQPSQSRSNSRAGTPGNAADSAPSPQAPTLTHRYNSPYLAQPDPTRPNTFIHPRHLITQHIFGPSPLERRPAPSNTTPPSTSGPTPRPASASTQQVAPPASRPTSASARHVAPPHPAQAQPRSSIVTVDAARATVGNGTSRSPQQPMVTGPAARGFVSQPLKFRQGVPHTTFLPQPGAPALNSVRPNPLRVALHQAHLRDPIMKLIRQGPAGEEETELFEYAELFPVGPTPLGFKECAFSWQFSLSSADCQRLSRSILRGVGERPLRVLSEGSRTIRFRCVKMPPSMNELTGHSWSVAETTWPSVLYIFVNSEEAYVRRKVHNGKDIPLDITDYLHEGINTIEVYLLRSPAESKDIFYVAAVESLAVAGYSSVKNFVQYLPASESRDRIQKRLSPRAEDEELTIVTGDLTVNLVDPFMARVFDTPVRGLTCAHLECFDLDTFLMTRSSKSGKGPMKSDWKCPICGEDARPQSLIVDGFLAEVHAELKRTNHLDDAKAIRIKADGSWELKADKENDAQDREQPNEEPTPTSFATKRKSDNLSGISSPRPQRLKTESATAGPSMPSHGANSSRLNSQTPQIVELD